MHEDDRLRRGLAPQIGADDRKPGNHSRVADNNDQDREHTLAAPTS
ncbi:hypothetical protein QOZ96_000673 [Brevundimonas nasdae]|nr:hypothetical protein [Brevundimonas nasdae]MBK6024087.1 hypothetical protein [Brevundimonas nasdae]MDQ0450742.1 hypothetical protein [Brevundimonas nasdae]